MTIPSSVTSIESYAFSGCSGLMSMTIGNGVTSIGYNAFSRCSGLTEISVGAANPLYKSVNGLLLTKDGKTLIRGINGDVSIPDSVTNIGDGAFSNCSGLTNVTIPSSVTNIESSAFYNCSGLTSVTIPDSVTSIKSSAFSGCSGLTSVKFDGNAPTMRGKVFNGVASSCCAYVRQSSSGWGVTIPGTWNDIAIEYVRFYDVKFSANGGTCSTVSMSVEGGTAIGALPVPTKQNAVFLGWFTSAEGGDRVDSSTIIVVGKTLYAHWLLSVDAPVVVPEGGLTFRAKSCMVTITCATEGATIYYTDDGTTPKKNDDYLYTGPFAITGTTTVKAVATVEGLSSDYTTVTIIQVPVSLEEALDLGEGVSVATDTVFPWMAVFDVNVNVGDTTARSGVIGNRTNTWLTATVSGAGTMSFWCKTSCEHDEDGTFTWDRLMVYTNGVEITDWRMDGETGWTQRELTFAGGENMVKWVYYKDKSDTAGEDCAWVDGITWTPSGVVAGLATWLAERNLAADDVAANGRTAAECYALGLDPTLATNDFRIVSIEMVDGEPKVEWEPKTNRWTGAELRAVLKGAASLEGPWAEVPAGGGSPGTARPTMQFFKVTVELP